MKQRYINTKFWSDNWVSNLDPIEKLLFIYLLTNERTNIAGIYELPLKYMSVETGIEKDMIDKVLRRFKKDEKINYNDGWVYIYNFQKHQDLSNPKIKKGVEIIIDSIPPMVRVSIGYTYPPNNTNTNSNTNSNSITNVIEKPRSSYGNEDINKVFSFLKEKLGGTPDGSQQENRRFAKLLLDRLKKDYPDKDSADQLCSLIEFGLRDKFHSKNITSFKYLYYNAQKIIQSVKGEINNPKVIKI